MFLLLDSRTEALELHFRVMMDGCCVTMYPCTGLHMGGWQGMNDIRWVSNLSLVQDAMYHPQTVYMSQQFSK